MDYPTHAYYQPGSMHLYDTANADGISTIWRKSRQEIQEEQPGILLLEYHQAVARAMEVTEREYMANSPKEITEEHWWEALEALPPVQWTRRGGAESFKMSEALTADITTCYVKIGDKYYSINDKYSTPHETLVAKCLDAHRAQSY